MNEQLTIFTSTTLSCFDSAELQLSFETLKSTFSQANWLIHSASSLESLNALVRQNMPTEGYVLFIKEPAVLIGEEMYPLLKKYLGENPGILIALPIEPSNTSSTITPNYHTLRGFERYSHELSQTDSSSIRFDGRECRTFLISAQSLSKLDLPENPFQLPHSLPNNKVSIVPQAYAHAFNNYYGEIRPEILPFVPQDIHSLLDIGCSQGGFAASVKKSINCRVAGIELNPHEAETAREVLDELWVGDVLKMEIPERFDCISCLDVLEHVTDSKQLLLKIKQWLTPDGTILLNVPNVGFWAVVEDLLAGRWDYVPAGVLCNTHLRFFTKQSLLELITSCSLTPVFLERQCIPIPEQAKTGFENYQKSGLAVDEENLSTIAFTVLAKCNS